MNVPAKKILLILLIPAVVYGCKNYKKTDAAQTRTDSLINSTGTLADSTHMRGARLVAANDCITCHSIDKRMFGPSFVEIATRYHNDEKLAEYLSNNVRTGSKGIYGNNAMTPHPNLDHNDLVQMLQYILSLKPKQ